jgi:major membrane immunogen (membrane-anchored lipoprotein)
MRGLKRLSVLLCALALALLTGCGLLSPYRDGVYTATAPGGGTGWQETLELTIEGGKIIKIDWDAVYQDDSIPIRKKQYSKSGLYGMLTVGAVGEWYDQALAAQQFVLQNGIDALNINEDGYTDAVAGCTISVKALDTMMRDCLNQAQK